MEQTVTNEGDPSGTTLEHLQTGIEDVVILPMVAIALVVKKVLRSAWAILKHVFDFLFPILLQLMRFPLFTLRILGDGIAALLKGIARILPIGGVRRAAWREFVSQRWAWLRQKISYKAFEEAVHHVFESGMAWVFRKCKSLAPSAALFVILGAVLWLPISFGVATLLHALLIAKATSLPAWMQLLHPVATIIAKSKLLVLPVLSGSMASGETTSIGASGDRILALFHDAIFRPENPLSLPAVRERFCGGGKSLRYHSFVLWTRTPTRLVVGGAQYRSGRDWAWIAEHCGESSCRACLDTTVRYDRQALRGSLRRSEPTACRAVERPSERTFLALVD
jgi:hypothetical protein